MTSDSSYPEEGSNMRRIHDWRGLRTWQRATMLGGMAVVGLSLAGLAVGAAASPKMEVLPSPINVKYSGTVEVKAPEMVPVPVSSAKVPGRLLPLATVQA